METPPHALFGVSTARQGLKSTLGIQVFWNPGGTDAQQEANADIIFNHVVSLGANTVGIDFFFATDGAKPTHVYSLAGTTPSTSTMAMATDQPTAPTVYNTHAPGSFIGRSDAAIKACFAYGWH